ncbi:hypothetical protein ACHAPU_006158 [Fusarium lateritium]
MTRPQNGYWSAPGGLFGSHSSIGSRRDYTSNSRIGTHITVRSGSWVGAESPPITPTSGETSTTTTPKPPATTAREKASSVNIRSSTGTGRSSIIPTWQRGRIRVPGRRNLAAVSTATSTTGTSSKSTPTRPETAGSGGSSTSSAPLPRRKPIVMRPRRRERVAQPGSGRPSTNNQSSLPASPSEGSITSNKEATGSGLLSVAKVTKVKRTTRPAGDTPRRKFGR